MKVKFLIAALINLLTVNLAQANNDACGDIQNKAKIETINGQSNIPNQSIVVASESRLYFYSAPDEICKQDGSFVIKGDLLYAYKVHDDFTYVNYLTSKGDEVKGWVKNFGLKEFSTKTSEVNIKHMNISDFIALNNSQWFGLGGLLSTNKLLAKDKEVSSSFIGDFPNENGGLNKFYSHTYKHFKIISSNINYDERLWTGDDDYIITNITLTTPEYHTIRNAKVGDKKEDILARYKEAPLKESIDKLTYTLGKMSLIFNVKNNAVTSIEMSSITEE